MTDAHAPDVALPSDELVSLIDAYLAGRYGRTIPFAIVTWDAPIASWASNVPTEEVKDVLGIVAMDLAGLSSGPAPREVA